MGGLCLGTLAFLSLKAAALPAISEELASVLAGSWISVLMFRSSVLDGFFALGKSEASPMSRGARALHLSPSRAIRSLEHRCKVLRENLLLRLVYDKRRCVRLASAA